MLKIKQRRRIASLPSTIIISILIAACTSAYAKTPDFVPGSWSLVLLPDIQYYTETYPGLLTMQTHWIAKNKDKFNIQYVLTLGDLTQNNSDAEWQRVKESFDELDGRVPYTLALGNHDYTPEHNPILGKNRLNEMFPVSKFKRWPTFGGTLKPDDMRNTYHLFSAGGADWIVFALEWLPSDDAVRWANDLLAKQPRRKAILTTHAYLLPNGKRWDTAVKIQPKQQSQGPQKPPKSEAELQKEVLAQTPLQIPGLIEAFHLNDGELLWQKLVKKNNFVFVINGHVLETALLSSRNDAGRTTHQMLVDYQGRKFGGEGYLRIIEFLPDGKTARVKSYSPLYDRYLDDAANQYDVDIQP
jgi:hypothetical protein